MDPNTAYQNLCRLMAESQEAYHKYGPGDEEWNFRLSQRYAELAVEILTNMEESWQALDSWLKNGGFLPTEWGGRK